MHTKSTESIGMNETVDLNRTPAMDATKTLNDNNNMSQSLMRSNTFVCDENDDAQKKLLSVTHNVSIDTTTNAATLNKERTFKRSLSPIPGDTMNAAKRKSVQSILDRKVMSGPILNSTPRQSLMNSDVTTNIQFPFFSAHKSRDDIGAATESQLMMENLQKFSLENTMAAYESAKNFVPDAVKSNGASNATMHNQHRTFDLTQTIVQSDTIHAGDDAKIEDGTFNKSCGLNKNKIDDVDSTKQMIGKCGRETFFFSFSISLNFFVVVFFHLVMQFYI